MPPPSSWLVLLDSRVRPYRAGDDDAANIQGRVLTSGPKLALGFSADDDDDADPVVQGLELGAQLAGAADLSFLTLRGGDQHYSAIHTVDRNLILIDWSCIQVYPSDVLLIYDAVDRSLRMMPSRPHTYPPPFQTFYVLVARRHDDDDDSSYALVYPGRTGAQDVLFLVPSSSSTSPWQTTKKANFPDNARPDQGHFDADQVFSFHGRGYWVDLLCGVLYCDCSEVLSDAIESVDIRSFDLPVVGCTKHLGSREGIPAARAFRAMGPVGDSIKFVSIDGYLEHVDLEDCKVMVWTLMEDLSWAVEHELRLASLWEGVEFRGDFVPPEMAPMYPFLSSEEDDVIYFALGCFPTEPRCMLRVDWRSKTVKCTRLSGSQQRCMTYHLALSSNAAEKLLN